MHRYEDARRAMAVLASHFTPKEIGSKAYKLYEQFRPAVAGGQRGWGAKGQLDLDFLLRLGLCDEVKQHSEI